MTSNPADVTQAMTEAYISWQPPTAADVSDPTRAMGLVRASFFNGYNAGLKEQADEIERLRAALQQSRSAVIQERAKNCWQIRPPRHCKCYPRTC